MNYCFLILCFVSAPVFGQNRQQECIFLSDFKERCDTSINNMDAFLNGDSIDKSKHHTIIACYNQLKNQFIGEQINLDGDHAEYIDTTIAKYDDVDSIYINLFSQMQSRYKAYSDELKKTYVTSYRRGGALFVDDLNMYVIDPNGLFYFNICEW